MTKGLLPLGSVVTLGLEGAPAFCVAGYYPAAGGMSCRYLGVPWPMGIVEGSDAMAFEESAIDAVLYRAEALPDETPLLDDCARLHEERGELLRALSDELEGQQTTEAVE